MMVLAGTIILLLLPVMAWGMGRQADSVDWDAPAEERAEAASDSWRGIGLTFLLLALLFAILFSAAPLALVLRP